MYDYDGQVTRSYFKLNDWLAKPIDDLIKDFAKLGINFYNWFSECCSSCKVNKGFVNSNKAIAYKLFTDGINTHREWGWDEEEDEDGNFYEVEYQKDFFRWTPRVFITHKGLTHEELIQAMEIFKKYFYVRWSYNDDDCLVIMPKDYEHRGKREPMPCKKLDVE